MIGNLLNGFCSSAPPIHRIIPPIKIALREKVITAALRDAVGRCRYALPGLSARASPSGATNSSLISTSSRLLIEKHYDSKRRWDECFLKHSNSWNIIMLIDSLKCTKNVSIVLLPNFSANHPLKRVSHIPT